MKVYMVMFDWATEDDSAVEVELFDTYKKAYDRFIQIIADEKKPEISWVGREALDENGEISDDYDFEEQIDSDGTQEYDCWWNITDKNDWYRHDFLDLQVVEVK